MAIRKRSAPKTSCPRFYKKNRSIFSYLKYAYALSCKTSFVRSEVFFFGFIRHRRCLQAKGSMHFCLTGGGQSDIILVTRYYLIIINAKYVIHQISMSNDLEKFIYDLPAANILYCKKLAVSSLRK